MNIKKIALDLFDLDENRKCRCGGEHEICLQCVYCRFGEKDQLAETDNLACLIDHTALKAVSSEEDINKLCDEAEKYKFASVCINPTNIEHAKERLKTVPVCTVIGFPLGANTAQAKIMETSDACKSGAEEIDMVINIAGMLDKKYDKVYNEIKRIADTCRNHGSLLKVIFENCYLTQEDIVKAALISKKAGAEFIKTSTGFGTSGAKTEDVRLMRRVAGPKIGVKAAGGIRDAETAVSMIKAGANRIGASASLSIIGVK
ncbi:MAG: deoxyribose-phosphate aldolase [Candidatus Cloacimonadota bacterium]|nr:MAG: deoxyribose-phosphate aldolase [Candidatus Cloacimonadota bacterium]